MLTLPYLILAHLLLPPAREELDPASDPSHFDAGSTTQGVRPPSIMNSSDEATDRRAVG